MRHPACVHGAAPGTWQRPLAPLPQPRWVGPTPEHYGTAGIRTARYTESANDDSLCAKKDTGSRSDGLALSSQGRAAAICEGVTVQGLWTYLEIEANPARPGWTNDLGAGATRGGMVLATWGPSSSLECRAGQLGLQSSTLACAAAATLLHTLSCVVPPAATPHWNGCAAFSCPMLKD